MCLEHLFHAPTWLHYQFSVKLKQLHQQCLQKLSLD